MNIFLIIAITLHEKSETKARENFINRYFDLNIIVVSGANNQNDFFQECIDKRKLRILFDNNFGAIYVKPPDASVNDETFLFVSVLNKKCLDLTKIDLFVRLFINEIEYLNKQNPLEMSSLRLAG